MRRSDFSPHTWGLSLFYEKYSEYTKIERENTGRGFCKKRETVLRLSHLIYIFIMSIETDWNFDTSKYKDWPINYESLSKDKTLTAEQIKTIALARIDAKNKEQQSTQADQVDAANLLNSFDMFDQLSLPPIALSKDAPSQGWTLMEWGEIFEKKAILERLKRTTFDFLGRKIEVDVNKVSLKKQWENYVFGYSAIGFEYIKTPLEMNKRWDLLTKEIQFDRGNNFLLPKNGTYKISQDGESVRIQEKPVS